jgi:arylsulfatase A-like enzyme
MRLIICQLARLLYLALAVVFLMMAIKPGASFFYHRRSMVKEAIAKDQGLAYKYLVDLNNGLFSPDGILAFENDQLLARTNLQKVVDSGNGRFTLGRQVDHKIELFFSARHNLDPINTESSYTIYLRYFFITRPVGVLVFFLLMFVPFLVEFLYFISRNREPHKSALHPQKLWGTIKAFLKDQDNWGLLFIHKADSIPPRSILFRRLFSINIFAVYFYLFMEWVFFITKPSFMDFMKFADKLNILLVTGLGISIVTLIVLAILASIDTVLRSSGLTDLLLDLMPWVPALFLTTAALLIFDNFTYTLFKVGIVTTDGILRGAYAVLFVGICIYFYAQVSTILFRTNTLNNKYLVYLAIGMLAGSFASALIHYDDINIEFGGPTVSHQALSNRPNIILLGGDGINASNLSVYGYERETSPNLEVLAERSLLAENNFTNAGNSTGSDVALLTGKLPIQTRVLYPPDILTGEDSYQHLPAILKDYGYHNIEMGVPYYVDANNLNMQNAFDVVNRNETENSTVVNLAVKYWFDDSTYFSTKLAERIAERLAHIFFIEKMTNPYDIVTRPTKPIADRIKIDDLLNALVDTEGPLFAHLHLLGTHGGKFWPATRVFSLGKEQPENWMTDFYDDAILEFDSYVGEVISHLKKIGDYDNTILVIYTDHSQAYGVNDRIPLIIHFPQDAHAGAIFSNTQNLDVSPTILDYLGIEIPSWMAGQSLLISDLDPHRLILSATTSKLEMLDNGLWTLGDEQVKPPYYQFSLINVIDCSSWYTIQLVSNTWQTGGIANHTAPCNDIDTDQIEQIKKTVFGLLAENGFEIPPP